jgi:hypothetical protein
MFHFHSVPSLKAHHLKSLKTNPVAVHFQRNKYLIEIAADLMHRTTKAQRDKEQSTANSSTC